MSHILTGSDTTSCLLQNWQKQHLKDLSKIQFLPEHDGLALVAKSYLLLYRNKDNYIRTLNNLRLKLATNSNKSSTELKPSDAAFYHHFLSKSTLLFIICMKVCLDKI